MGVAYITRNYGCLQLSGVDDQLSPSANDQQLRRNLHLPSHCDLSSVNLQYCGCSKAGSTPSGSWLRAVPTLPPTSGGSTCIPEEHSAVSWLRWAWPTLYRTERTQSKPPQLTHRILLRTQLSTAPFAVNLQMNTEEQIGDVTGPAIRIISRRSHTARGRAIATPTCALTNLGRPVCLCLHLSDSLFTAAADERWRTRRLRLKGSNGAEGP